MKRFLLPALIFSAFVAASQADTASTGLPAAASNSVSDLAGVLTSERSKELADIIDRVEKQTGVETGVLVLKSIQNQSLPQNQFDQYVFNLFNAWGVGHKAINNGVLVVVSLKERMIRFQFGSDYNQDDLTILSEKYDTGVLPLLQAKNYSDGVFAASMLAIQAAAEDVSWWWYHRVALIIFALAFIALGGVIWSAKHNVREGVRIGLVVFVALVALGIYKYFPDNRLPGFNGGQTTGIGLTRRWPTT